MVEKRKAAFLVDAESEPAIIAISGRASFTNSAPLRDFFDHLTKAGRRHFVLDFADCISMDSTFLGIIAGAALKLQRLNPPGSMILCRLGEKKLEMVRNLGLHRIMLIGRNENSIDLDKAKTRLKTSSGKAELENAKLVLEAHENLIEADEQNREKFQDVVSFLKNQVEEM